MSSPFSDQSGEPRKIVIYWLRLAADERTAPVADYWRSGGPDRSARGIN
jgi:hypothetical protein